MDWPRLVEGVAFEMGHCKSDCSMRGEAGGLVAEKDGEMTAASVARGSWHLHLEILMVHFLS